MRDVGRTGCCAMNLVQCQPTQAALAGKTAALQQNAENTMYIPEQQTAAAAAALQPLPKKHSLYSLQALEGVASQNHLS